MLTLAAQGMLVCDALNQLPDKDDLISGVTTDGCCWRCCAPCGLLNDLYAAGQLNTVVRQAPEHLWGPGLSWWVGNRQSGEVDGAHLLTAWDWIPCPDHEPV